MDDIYLNLIFFFYIISFIISRVIKLYTENYLYIYPVKVFFFNFYFFTLNK